MTLKQRINAFVQVGGFIKRHYSGQRLENEAQLHQGLEKLTEAAFVYNGWFIPKFVNEAIFSLSGFLEEEELTRFCEAVSEKTPKTVAVVCAGNIPLVCFHDVLCVLLSGHKALIKMSSDDHVLLPFFLKLLCHYEPAFEAQVLFADGKISSFDAIIATGSDNTAGHLYFYFGKYPNVIRRNRSSVAVLTGQETTEELKQLGKDIFHYFGLGCRNVSMLLVPRGYSFTTFFESILDYGFVAENKKYGNNYDYHRAIYLLESIPFLDNNFLMLRESTDLHSPVGTLHYRFYDSEQEINDYLYLNNDKIQCVVGKNRIPFGYSQKPVISDFADGLNTLDFLVNL